MLWRPGSLHYPSAATRSSLLVTYVYQGARAVRAAPTPGPHASPNGPVLLPPWDRYAVRSAQQLDCGGGPGCGGQRSRRGCHSVLASMSARSSLSMASQWLHPRAPSDAGRPPSAICLPALTIFTYAEWLAPGLTRPLTCFWTVASSYEREATCPSISSDWALRSISRPACPPAWRPL